MRKGIKTKKKIAEAFKNLMIEKSFEDIRVQDITDLTSLDFKSPDQIVSEYFSKCNICLDN